MKKQINIVKLVYAMGVMISFISFTPITQARMILKNSSGNNSQQQIKAKNIVGKEYLRRRKSSYKNRLDQKLVQASQTWKIKVWINTFIPAAQVIDPFNRCFAGDNRSFSNRIHAPSRTHQEIEFDVSTLAKTINWKKIGKTHKLDCTTSRTIETAKAPNSQLENGRVTRKGRYIYVNFKAAAENPLVNGAPAIDMDLTFKINPITRKVIVYGQHDGFPAYEAYITTDGGAGKMIYQYDPRKTQDTPRALFPPMEINAKSGIKAF